jgi:hypothetical protein
MGCVICPPPVLDPASRIPGGGGRRQEEPLGQGRPLPEKSDAGGWPTYERVAQSFRFLGK